MRKPALALLVVIVLAIYPLVVTNHFFLHLSIMALLYALLGMSWNLLGGYTGQISFGHAAFFGTGAYTSTILLLRYGISPWLGMLVGAVLAVLLSLPLGWLTFRLRGPYFALATLAFAEVVRVIVYNWDSLTGGGDGLNILTDLGGIVRFYYIILALTVVGALLMHRCVRSRWGYFLNAIREDEDAAEALGVPATRMKLTVLAISAFFVALAGSFFASYQLYINPDLVYEPQISIQMIVVTIVGGIGTFEGPVVGALVIVPLSEYFRGLSPVANPLIYGLFIVIFMMFLPEGIVSRIRSLLRRRAPAVAEEHKQAGASV
ncbi:MAG TPA: branched-chain amino acid ABC transporter permease [Terriglobales bacterium]|jgi:branched-chain amino acid transport system permease protein|nr:branched-chain amino acid ABC transporter permease [Terriglobales bacterium]